MQIDLILPTVSLVFLNAIVWAYPRVEPRMKRFMEGGEFTVKDALGLAIVLAVSIAVLALTPSALLLILSMIGIGFVLNLTSLIITGNRWISVILPSIFYVCFFFFWNLKLLNLFAIILAFGTSLILADVFTWRSSLAFIAVLTLIDVIHVFGTKMMIEVGARASGMELPLLLRLPTYPVQGEMMLGLGDLFVASLVTIRNWERFGGKAGLITSIYIAIFLLSIVPLFQAFRALQALPATIFIVAGWITSYIHLKATGNKDQ